MKSKKKDLKLVTALIIAVIAIVIIGWAVINPGTGGAATSPTIMLGLNLNPYKDNFSTATLLPLVKQGAEQGILVYGYDTLFAPTQKTSGQWDFTKLDTNFIPYVQQVRSKGRNPFFAVSFNDAAIEPAYKRLVQKGLLSSKNPMLYFNPYIADELTVKTDADVLKNNQAYDSFKNKFPYLQWLTTSVIPPFVPGRTLSVKGDIFMENPYDSVIVNKLYSPYQIGRMYAGKIRASYQPGSGTGLTGSLDEVIAEPSYYKYAASLLKITDPVPNFQNDASSIFPWLVTHNETPWFLNWSLVSFLQKNEQGAPVPTSQLIQMITSMNVS